MNIYEAIVVAGIENCQIRRSGWCEGYAIMPTDSQKTAMVMITPTKVQPRWDLRAGDRLGSSRDGVQGDGGKKMIKTEKGITEIEGGLVEIMADTALVLANLYVISKDKLGEASAREMIVDVGRVAMADEMIARIEKKRTALGSSRDGVQMEGKR